MAEQGARTDLAAHVQEAVDGGVGKRAHAAVGGGRAGAAAAAGGAQVGAAHKGHAQRAQHAMPAASPPGPACCPDRKPFIPALIGCTHAACALICQHDKEHCFWAVSKLA